MWISLVDIVVTELQEELSGWLERVRDGDEVVVMQRGAVARIVVGDSAGMIESLTARSVIARPVRSE